MRDRWFSTYKLSEESSEWLVERLLDIINMNQDSLTVRTQDSLEALEEVRAMDTLQAE